MKSPAKPPAAPPPKADGTAAPESPAETILKSNALMAAVCDLRAEDYEGKIAEFGAVIRLAREINALQAQAAASLALVSDIMANSGWLVPPESKLRAADREMAKWRSARAFSAGSLS